jgi:hypothetical protein
VDAGADAYMAPAEDSGAPDGGADGGGEAGPTDAGKGPPGDVDAAKGPVDAGAPADSAPAACIGNPANYTAMPYCAIVPNDAGYGVGPLCPACEPTVWVCGVYGPGTFNGIPNFDSQGNVYDVPIDQSPFVPVPTINTVGVTLCTASRLCAGTVSGQWCPPIWIDEAAGTWNQNPSAYPLPYWRDPHLNCQVAGDGGTPGLFTCN